MRDSQLSTATPARPALCVIELVRFHLAPGVTPDQFLALTAATAPLVSASPGFLRRMVFCDETGLWTDLVEWQDSASAQAAAESLMPQPAFAGFCAAIDMETVQMQHLPMLWRSAG